jgi:hypothetical protein
MMYQQSVDESSSCLSQSAPFVTAFHPHHKHQQQHSNHQHRPCLDNTNNNHSGAPYTLDESRLPVSVLIQHAPGIAPYEDKYAKVDHAFQTEKKLEVREKAMLMS